MGISQLEILQKAIDDLDNVQSQDSDIESLERLMKSFEKNIISDGDKQKCDSKTDGKCTADSKGTGDGKGAGNLSKDDEDEDEDKDEDNDYSDTDDDSYGDDTSGKKQDKELIKASVAFESLEKAIHSSIANLDSEIRNLKKSVACIAKINVAQAKVVATMAKSRENDFNRLIKSIGSVPTQTGVSLGVGSSARSESNISNADIQEKLIKAVQTGGIDARYLSIYSTYKDVSRLPEDVRRIVGL